jgi:SAM-dependent methyltransferase
VFVLHDREDLSRYAAGSVDFLSCLLVLQHLPSRDGIERYLREFVRVLSPGGVAVVQLPVRVSPADVSRVGYWSRLRRLLQLRTRGTRFLRAVGVSPTFLYERLGWEPEMLMSGIPYEETVTVFETAGGRVLDAPPEDAHPGGVMSRTYFVASRDGGAAGLAGPATSPQP